jgi:hypothetical protein
MWNLRRGRDEVVQDDGDFALEPKTEASPGLDASTEAA